MNETSLQLQPGMIEIKKFYSLYPEMEKTLTSLGYNPAAFLGARILIGEGYEVVNFKTFSGEISLVFKNLQTPQEILR